MRWMNNHESVSMYNHEIHALKNGHPDELVELLYRLPEGEYKRGYKGKKEAHQFFLRHLASRGLTHLFQPPMTFITRILCNRCTNSSQGPN